MIVDEHVREFINSLNPQEDELILALEKEAHENHVPIIRKETKELLRFILRTNSFTNILEIGTAIGYSAIVMHQCQPVGGKIDTIERNEGRYVRAKNNIETAGYTKDIHIHFGDAVEVLKTLDDCYDMVFMDAAKGQYSQFFDLSVDKLKKNGLLVCDNILQEGSVAMSRYAVTRRDRTIHGRMREFLYHLKQDDNWDTVILPVGDGIALARKK